MSFHVYQCEECGAWREGAAYRLPDAPRDQYGRLAYGYEGPKFCSSSCAKSAALLKGAKP